jgi:hypothetical protein
MNPSWTRTVEPSLDPIDTTEAKLHARIPSADTSNDTVILSYIRSATKAAEDYMARGLLTQTWKLVLAIRSRRDVSADGRTAAVGHVGQVLRRQRRRCRRSRRSVYDVDTVSRPGRIALATNQTWPTTVASRLAGVVEITYVVGFTSPPWCRSASSRGFGCWWRTASPIAKAAIRRSIAR